MKNKHNVTLAVLAIIFFVIYSWHGIIAPQIYNSPDETANYFFIRQFFQNGDFFSSESLNAVLNNNLHPRSILFNGNSLVPQGFIGLPLLYGFLAKIFGLFFLKFFTPLLAVLGALAFHGIIEKIFSRKVAFLSMILLLFFPVFWYFSSRYLYPNVPFFSLLLIAVWALCCGALHQGAKRKFLIIFGLTFGAAAAIRPAELLWILPAIAVGLIIYRKNLSAMKIFFAVAMIYFLAIPVLSNNYILYGNALGAGYGLSQPVYYGAPSQSGAILSGGGFLPFGFHLKAIIKNVYNILIKYFWWYSIPAILGFILLFFHKIKRTEKFYIFLFLTISAWLIFFYGSGTFTDNPNIGTLSIGDSHFRYWLPIFAIMIPFAAFFWTYVAEKLKQEKVLLPAGLVFVGILSIYSVYFSVDDGLRNVEKVLRKNYEIKLSVLGIVPEDAIIIAGRQDKIFFSERRVLFAEKLLDNKLISNISRIKIAEFYYYGLGLDREDTIAADDLLHAYGLHMERVAIFGKEVLYKLERIDKISAYFFK